MTRWQNWSRGVRAHPRHIARPSSEAELATVVEEAVERGDTIRVAGSGHSFSPVVPSDDTLISLERYRGIVDIDEDTGQATVRAGTTLDELNPKLAEYDLAMENLGDIDRQTLAGALTTGTHGTGLDFGILATQATHVRVLTADGTFVDIYEGDEEFPAAQVSLGALGVITELTLDLVPAYDLCLRRRALPVDEVLSNLDSFHGDHRNWEFFWFPHTDRALVKTFDTIPEGAGNRIDDGDSVDDFLDDLGARVENFAWESVCRIGTKYPQLASHGSRLAAGTLSDKTEVGRSYEVYANPRNVRFNETEYSLPADSLADAVADIRDYIETSEVPVQFPLECRFVGGDDPYLSPAHGRDSGFIAAHTYYRKSLPDYFDQCEAIFDQYQGRPHWGKQHSKTAATLASLYPEWERFQDVRREFDPDGIFLNDHLASVMGVEMT